LGKVRGGRSEGLEGIEEGGIDSARRGKEGD